MRFDFIQEIKVFFCLCMPLDLNFNHSLLQVEVILEIEIRFHSMNDIFPAMPQDLKINGCLLRFKIILVIEIRFDSRNDKFFGTSPGSEIQRWLVAI